MNVKEQFENSVNGFKNAFGEEMTYNGIKINAIHDEEETNYKLPYQRGTADRDYFSLSVKDVSPKPNDKIVYLGETYRVVRIRGISGGFVQVETEKNNSVFPQGK